MRPRRNSGHASASAKPGTSCDSSCRRRRSAVRHHRDDAQSSSTSVSVYFPSDCDRSLLSSFVILVRETTKRRRIDEETHTTDCGI
jgi:hypothetical protein